MLSLMIMSTIVGAAAPPLFADLMVCGIEIDFDQLRANEPQQRALRDPAKATPALWTIIKPNLDLIEQVGAKPLHQHPCFQRWLSGLAKPPVFLDVTFAQTGCPPGGRPFTTVVGYNC